MLEVRNLSLVLDTARILHQVSFRLKKGATYGILGQSGTGKSSLLNIISGHLAPSDGQIICDGKLMPKAQHMLVPGYPDIALVSASYHLDWNHSCKENIRESILGWEIERREQKIEEMLWHLKLHKVKDTKAKFLSEGEKQRLAIARSLSNKPSWLLLDEPFGHQDLVNKITLMHFMATTCKSHNIGMLLVSHDPQEIMMFCQKTAILDTKGKVTPFKTAVQSYFNLKNKALSQLMGPVNVVKWKGSTISFRPNAYSICDDGIFLQLQDVYFNGMVYVHLFVTNIFEEVILYNQNKLNNPIIIQPRFDD